MSLKLAYYGNDILGGKAREVTDIDSSVRHFIDSMFRAMYRFRGVGLAAPQVHVDSRIITIDVDDGKTEPLALINPVIVESSDDSIVQEEGCLSLPGIEADVLRPSRVVVKGITPREKEIIIEADGLLARALQHEIDHLDGILFIDRVDDYIRKELRPHLKKIRRMALG